MKIKNNNKDIKKFVLINILVLTIVSLIQSHSLISFL